MVKGFLFTIFIGLFTALLPLIYEPYVNVGVWCFFKQSYGGSYTRDILFRLLLFYVLQWITFILNIILNAQSIKIFNKNSEKKLKNVYSMIRYYPICMMICYLPQTILRVFESSKVDAPLEFVNFAYFMSRLIGFADAVIFVSTSKIKKMLFNRKPKNINMSGHLIYN